VCAELHARHQSDAMAPSQSICSSDRPVQGQVETAPQRTSPSTTIHYMPSRSSLCAYSVLAAAVPAAPPCISRFELLSGIGCSATGCWKDSAKEVPITPPKA